MYRSGTYVGQQIREDRMIPGSGFGLSITGNYEARVSRLSRQWHTIVGALDNVAFIGDSIIPATPTTIGSWPSERGITTASHVNSNIFGLNQTNGIRHLSNSSIGTQRLQASLPASTLEMWMVVKATTLPAPDYYCCCMVTNSGANPIRFGTIAINTSTWYSPNSDVKRDGVNTADLASGWHVYKRYLNFAGASNTLSIGNDSEVPTQRTWKGDIAFIGCLSGPTSAQQTTDLFKELMAYYKPIM